MNSYHVDSMGGVHPTPVMDQRTMPIPTSGAMPPVTVGMRKTDIMAAAVVRSSNSMAPEALTNHPLTGLPFDPTAPVPADARGLTYVRWPVPGGMPQQY